MPKKPDMEVLKYRRAKRPQGTIRRHYLRWRAAQDPPLPIRCDNPECQFHAAPLVWNGKAFVPILDHVDGNRLDNSPKKLRLLCPLCDSQLPTRGGANKGRVIPSEGGFAIVRKDGKRDYTMPCDPGHYEVVGSDAGLQKQGVLNLKTGSHPIAGEKTTTPPS
jgi:hypothetical protein